jgi:hypothetical protein
MSHTWFSSAVVLNGFVYVSVNFYPGTLIVFVSVPNTMGDLVPWIVEAGWLRFRFPMRSWNVLKVPNPSNRSTTLEI